MLLHLYLEKVFYERQIHETSAQTIILSVANITLEQLLPFSRSHTFVQMASSKRWLIAATDSFNSFNSFVNLSGEGNGVQSKWNCVHSNQLQRKKKKKRNKTENDSA